MDAEEVSVESGTGPPAEFGHHEPVLGLAVAAFRAEGPGVEPIDELEGIFPPDTELNAQIGSGGCIVEKVGLDGEVVARLISGRLRDGEAQTQQQQQCRKSFAAERTQNVLPAMQNTVYQ